MKRILALCALVLLSPWCASAQETSPVPQFLQTLRPRCIGPANMSGRITEIAVYEKEPRIQYVASATGGLWKTINNGTTWQPVFEREKTVALGAVAVCQTNPDIVWVGTGEANARNSVSWGDGVYLSTDGCKSWKNMGLKEIEHVGRIVIHPKNPDVVYVAALGKVWGPNKERGVFKTTDAGKTWHHVFGIVGNVGCIDLAMDPENPELLYAAAYHVRRDAFSGGNPAVQVGLGSGLYKTSDGGKNWELMGGGLPGRLLGRCGFSIFRKNPNIIYAVVQTDRTSVTTKGQAANEKLDLEAGGVFRSDDKGRTWRHLNSLVPRPFYYGQIRVDPNDEQRLYVLGISFHVSVDGGRSFLDGNRAKGTHSDYHALWINPRDSHHLILGCDGGLNYSYDKGRTWEHLKNLPVAQFYAIGVDMRKPYRVYGGLQDNGSWGGPSTTRDPAGINYAQWFNILGFDGYYCQVHPKDNDIVYCEGQYGMLRRKNVHTGATIDIKPRLDSKEGKSNIRPRLPKGTPDFRFNWSSPILQSPYADDEVFYGSNVLFVTQDRGDIWQIASPDLTRGKPGSNDYKGHSITTIAGSPLEDYLLYVGTDDGKIWVCKNWKTKEWTDLSERIPNLPQERWITRLEASRFAKGTVYLTIDRHRHDDRKPYVFKSTDYGSRWTSIAGNLPGDEPIHVIREDPVNKDLLYVGTEFGLYLSLDAGKTWHKQKHLPTVPVHDLVVHAREHELVIATHGRAIWIMDILPLQELTQEALQEVRFCTIRPASAHRFALKQNLGVKNFLGENAAYGASMYLYLHSQPAQPPLLTISTAQGKRIADIRTDRASGLQRLTWNLSQPSTRKGEFNPVPAGNYTAVLRVGEKQYKQSFQVEVDD
jgi:photosystem II stability/assembly factor-like uncharacterized protein